MVNRGLLADHDSHIQQGGIGWLQMANDRGAPVKRGCPKECGAQISMFVMAIVGWHGNI